MKQPNQVFESQAGAAEQGELEARRRVYFDRHLQAVETHLAPLVSAPRLLEIGCGSGALLSTARARGWQVSALELSPALAAVAREANPGAEIRVGDVVAASWGAACFDAVVALDVVEHVREPAQMLAHCLAALRPGGLLLLQTPNTRGLRSRWQGSAWSMRDPRQHLNLFSPQGLQGLLSRSGFAVVRCRTVSGSGTECGAGRWLAAAKERVLGWGGLGNGIWVLARRRLPVAFSPAER